MNVLIGILAALAAGIGAPQPVQPLPSAVPGDRAPPLPSAVPGDRAQLQADLDVAQRIIDAPTSSSAALASAGEFEQLATLALAREPSRVQLATLAALAAPAARTMRTNLDAAVALSRLVTPRRSLPPWRIEPPPAPDTLLAYFKAAQASSGIAWQYLAAIEFVETKFGRVHGLSTAGAEGPMQFLPATWARYGRGDVHNPRDAIFGAARYLLANGAPRHMSGALYHYNPSTDYVRAITDYANRMRADPRAYDGYYWWQVIYAKRGQPLILPVGFPRVRPVAITLPGAPRSG
jgi:membrane-bound lytic murein transglycosylase B